MGQSGMPWIGTRHSLRLTSPVDLIKSDSGECPLYYSLALPRYTRDRSTPLLPTPHPPPYPPLVYKGLVNTPPTHLPPAPLPLPRYTRDWSTPLLPTPLSLHPSIYKGLVNPLLSTSLTPPYPPSVYKGLVNPPPTQLSLSPSLDIQGRYLYMTPDIPVHDT